MGAPRKSTAAKIKNETLVKEIPIKADTEEKIVKTKPHKKLPTPRALEASLYNRYNIPQSLNEKELRAWLKITPRQIEADEVYFLLRMKREYKMLDVYYTLATKEV